MSIDISSNITEEVLMHAQRIVTFFGNALQTDMCLVQVPVAALMEADQYLDRADVLNQADKIYGRDVDQIDKDVTQFNESPIVTAIRSNSRNRCFNCNIPIDKISFKNFKTDLANDIKNFLNNGSQLFIGGVNGSLPNLAFLLSFLCLPDLTKLLSMMLMRLIGTLGKFNLGNFNLTGFIMAIIGKILKAMLSFLNTVINYSLSPITCIIETMRSLSTIATAAGDELSQAIEQGASNVQLLAEDSARLAHMTTSTKSATQYQKSVDEFNTSLDNFSNDSAEANERFRGAMKEMANSVKQPNIAWANNLEKDFDNFEATLKSGVTHITEQIQNLFGLKHYFECEAKRNGTSVASELEGMQNTIMIINLIRAVIKKKTQHLAEQSVVSSNRLNTSMPSSDKQFDVADIASVVADTLGKQVAIASANGTDIGVLIGDTNIPLNDSLDLFSCNLVDFIDNSDFNTIISDAADIVSSGTGTPPMIPRITLDDVYNNTNANYVFAPINPNQLDNIAEQMKDVMDYLGAVTVPVTTASSQSKISGNVNTGGNINGSIPMTVEDIDINSITARLHQLS